MPGTDRAKPGTCLGGLGRNSWTPTPVQLERGSQRRCPAPALPFLEVLGWATSAYSASLCCMETLRVVTLRGQLLVAPAAGPWELRATTPPALALGLWCGADPRGASESFPLVGRTLPQVLLVDEAGSSGALLYTGVSPELRALPPPRHTCCPRTPPGTCLHGASGVGRAHG